MHEILEPPTSTPLLTAITDAEIEELEALRRSPHPYHHEKSELLHPSEQLAYRAAAVAARNAKAFTRDSTPASESGTEADDEHILKGLPAPRARLHKGLRGMNEELLSGRSTPLPSPAILDEDSRREAQGLKDEKPHRTKRVKAESSRRRKEVFRRVAEMILLAGLGGLVWSNQDARPYVALWGRELRAHLVVLLGLFALYPMRLVIWAYTRHQRPSRRIPISIPSAFDPAPVLYPQLIPIFVSLLVAVSAKGVILANIVLGLCTLPGTLIPTTRFTGPINPVHWLISCIPLFVGDLPLADFEGSHLKLDGGLPTETLVLLYPLHQNLCMILQFLTTTSLLTAELQLLSVSLINILLLSSSPQAEILKALLWVGGLSTLILCGPVIRWGISLARVPKWRFSRVAATSKGLSVSRSLRGILLLVRRPRHEFLASDFEESSGESGNSSDEDFGLSLARASTATAQRKGSATGTDVVPIRQSLDTADVRSDLANNGAVLRPAARRHTLPALGLERSKTHTPSGRRKRSASTTVRSFFNLTYAQATARKWLYAGYVYITIAAIVLVGVRLYIQLYALSDAEPIGWALGYIFGDLPKFRFQVVNANQERWILLPERSSDTAEASCHLGHIAHIRHTFLGEANTRLVLSSYFLLVIVTGLAIVLRLSPVYEVDTRRKVFHFMMVAMFLPATFVDPTFCALGLAVVLAVFLLLDLVRASQLPPFSKPIATFLTPYVDGRDLRGPVVVSHIFLLIGCAIPLWLSLAAVPRIGEGALRGWEVPTRDISMVSGVVCVGLGDAAASLIGRRWGRRKWLWGGGKSLEGSIAFALAVFVGLMAANVWLRVGGWPVSGQGVMHGSWWAAARKSGLCATVASLTEAVLTGGNDNVVVPVVLWTCVKSTGL